MKCIFVENEAHSRNEKDGLQNRKSRGLTEEKKQKKKKKIIEIKIELLFLRCNLVMNDLKFGGVNAWL